MTTPAGVTDISFYKVLASLKEKLSSSFSPTPPGTPPGLFGLKVPNKLNYLLKPYYFPKRWTFFVEPGAV